MINRERTNSNREEKAKQSKFLMGRKRTEGSSIIILKAIHPRVKPDWTNKDLRMEVLRGDKAKTRILTDLKRRSHSIFNSIFTNRLFQGSILLQDKFRM